MGRPIAQGERAGGLATRRGRTSAAVAGLHAPGKDATIRKQPATRTRLPASDNLKQAMFLTTSRRWAMMTGAAWFAALAGMFLVACTVRPTPSATPNPKPAGPASSVDSF